MSVEPTSAGTSPGTAANQLTLTLASFVAFASFTLVMPFLPLVFREVGVSGTGLLVLLTAFVWATMSTDRRERAGA